MDHKKTKLNVSPDVSPIEEKDEIDEKTPTNENMEVSDSNPSQENPYRFCISPMDTSEASSGSETTPDAALLNNSPFEVKLKPKLLRKSSSNTQATESSSNIQATDFSSNTQATVSSNIQATESSSNTQATESSDDQNINTPEKLGRPVNFKNLSPRSVSYEFTTRYPSGIMRPRKISRSFNSLLNNSPMDHCYSKSLEQVPARSDEPIGTIEKASCERSPPRKKHIRSVSFSERVDVCGIINFPNNSPMDPCCSKSLEQVRARTDEPIGIIEKDSCERSPPRKKPIRSVYFSESDDDLHGFLKYSAQDKETDELAVYIGLMNVSPETENANESIQSTETAATGVIPSTEDTSSYTHDNADQCSPSQR